MPNIQIDILPFTPYRLRLRLPLPNLVGPALRAALRHHIPDKEIVGLTQVDPLCAVLHLRSAESMTQLLRLRHLTTTGTTGTAASPKTGLGPTSSKAAKAAAKGQTPPASPAKPSAKHLSAKALGGTKTGAAEVLPGSAKSPAASKVRGCPQRPRSGASTHLLFRRTRRQRRIKRKIKSSRESSR
jgi:hypothetical protein